MENRKGFTLIELMIVAAIFSLLLLSIYSAFRTGLLSQERVDVATNLYQRVRLSLTLVEADLKNAFVYTKADSRFTGSPESMQFFTVFDDYDKDGKISSNIGCINYEVADNFLKRKAYEGVSALKDNSGLEGESFLSGIEEFSFQFAAISTNSGKLYEWQDIWPKEGDLNQKKELPVAVKIRFILKQKDNSLVEFNKVIPLYV